MNIWELNYFICIADQKSLTRAAEKLFLSQWAVLFSFGTDASWFSRMQAGYTTKVLQRS